MSDLLSYSIMNNNTTTTTSTNNKYHSNHTKTVLPPISSITNQLPPLGSIITSPIRPSTINNNSNINLPTLNQYYDRSYTTTTSTTTTNNGLTTPSPPPLKYSYSNNNLTEANLSKFETSRNCHGLGLLSSAVLYQQQNNCSTSSSSSSSSPNGLTLVTPPPSLTSRTSSISSISTPSSPHINDISITKTSTITPTTSKTSKTSTIIPTSKNQCQVPTKRRQRLGPSCDSCRIRKVKCDAEIQIINEETIINEYCLQVDEINEIKSGKKKLLLSSSSSTTTSSTSSNCLENGGTTTTTNNNNKAIKIELIYSHGKFIKFKSCQNCIYKLNVDCCFKNGYTKEDILHNKKLKIFHPVTNTNTNTNTTINNSSNSNSGSSKRIMKKKLQK